MAELPSGTVTFLLTDVEGSPALWEQAPEAMRPALARHDALFDDAVRQHGGVHIRPRGEGDGRFAVFASAPYAVAVAARIDDDVIVMYAGRIVEMGTSGDIGHSPSPGLCTGGGAPCTQFLTSTKS
jgi:class 3 adenylate cyclase